MLVGYLVGCFWKLYWIDFYDCLGVDLFIMGIFLLVFFL